jgi:hypothetical protein
VAELKIYRTYIPRTENPDTLLNHLSHGIHGQALPLSLYCQRRGRVEVTSVPVIVTVKQWCVNANEICSGDDPYWLFDIRVRWPRTDRVKASGQEGGDK